jgi:phosphoglycerate kinase
VGGGIANTFMLAAGLPHRQVAWPSPTCWREAQRGDRGHEGRAAPRCRIPVDVVVRQAASPPTRRPRVKAAGDVAADDLILDIGPQTAGAPGRSSSKPPAPSSGTARWACSSSTPFADGTEALARAIARQPAPSASPAAATRWRRSPSTASTTDVGYISTGGGAFLEFLEGKRTAGRGESSSERA